MHMHGKVGELEKKYSLGSLELSWELDVFLKTFAEPGIIRNESGTSDVSVPACGTETSHY